MLKNITNFICRRSCEFMVRFYLPLELFKMRNLICYDVMLIPSPIFIDSGHVKIFPFCVYPSGRFNFLPGIFSRLCCETQFLLKPGFFKDYQSFV